MRIGVDEAALVRAADSADHAMGLLATWRLDAVATAVAQAMPGSRSADTAARLAHLADDVVTGLARELAVHADLLRTASIRYADTESDVAASTRTPGAA